MPIYEYACEECKTRFERLVMSKNGKPECPKCGSHKAAMQFSVFAAHGGNGGGSASAISSSESAPSSASGCGCTPRGCGCH